MAPYKTAEKAYFQRLMDEMIRKGFRYMAWVTMNSKTSHYHVDMFRFAQESRLFFNVPGKAFIVMLALTEQFGNGPDENGRWDENYKHCYWNGFIEYSYNRQSWCEAEIEWRLAHGQMISDDPRSIEEEVSKCLDPEVFRWGSACGHNCYFEQVVQPNGNSKDLLDAKTMTSSFGKMLAVLTPHLHSRFKELQVTSYAPHYTFPGQEKKFWSMFPLCRLERVADRVWGSDFE
ncbi:MAG: hypothetical protein PHU42_00240 [Patescibacteria group bacterium]|nr:hypothetical protein [Patescibacteria group bacterium]